MRVAAPSTSRQIDKAVENAEFELEFDAVNEWFPGSLDYVLVRELKSDDAEVEHHD